MVLIQIRDVEPEVRDELKARAAREGVSLNTYLTSILVHAAKQTPRATVPERIAARTEAASVSSVDVIRRARNERAGDLGRANGE